MLTSFLFGQLFLAQLGFIFPTCHFDLEALEVSFFLFYSHSYTRSPLSSAYAKLVSFYIHLVHLSLLFNFWYSLVSLELRLGFIDCRFTLLGITG